MQNVIVIGKRFVSVAHVALIEAFDPEANPRFQPTQDYKSRVVLLNRDNLLTLETVEAFAKEHGFRVLADDQAAINPSVFFSVESFTAAEGFTPSKPFQTRLRWRDFEGNDQSKLMLTAPEAVLAVLMRNNGEPAEENANPKPTRRRANAARRRAVPQAGTNTPA